MWQELAPWLGSGGAAVLAWLGYRFHRDAVEGVKTGAAEAIAAERRRADDWRAAYEASERRATVREAQISTLLTGVRERA